MDVKTDEVCYQMSKRDVFFIVESAASIYYHCCYSTVTDFAKFLGQSTLHPLSTAI